MARVPLEPLAIAALTRGRVSIPRSARKLRMDCCSEDISENEERESVLEDIDRK